MPADDRPKYRCFLALPHAPEFAPVRDAVSRGVSDAGYKGVSLDQWPILPGIAIRESIVGDLARTDCVVADISDRNPNVYFELGLAEAMGKGSLIIANKRSANNIPSDVRDFQLLFYEDTQKGL